MVAEPAEVQSIKSMLHIARLLAILVGIIVLVAGILSFVVRGVGPFYGAWFVIAFVVAFLVYTQMHSIEDKVNARQYEAAKTQTLIWMVLGLIFGIILGLILLVAFLKFDPLINWQWTQGAVPPPGYVPQYAAPVPMAAAPMATSPPPAAPAVPAAAPFCVKCGKPTTYIAQYGRYYCYDDNLYV